MTPIDALLCQITHWDKSFTKFQRNGQTVVPLLEVGEYLDAILKRVRELKPLLEAGERMRDVAMFHGGTPEAERWDRALKGGRDGS